MKTKQEVIAEMVAGQLDGLELADLKSYFVDNQTKYWESVSNEVLIFQYDEPDVELSFGTEL